MTAFPVTGPQTVTFSQVASLTFPLSASQTVTFSQATVGNKDAVRAVAQDLFFVQSQARGLSLPVGITITESIESRRLEKTSKGRQLTRIFFIKGTDDPVQADALGPQIGDTYLDTDGNPEGTGFADENLFAARRTLSPGVVGVDSDDKKLITLEVLYGELDTNPSGVNRQVSLDISGQSVRVERAISQEHFPSGDADIEAEWGKAIGPKTKENELKGVDRLDTAVSLSETHERSRMDQDYIKTLLDLHGTVNNAVFRGFAAERVLFQGFRADTNADGQWQVQYEFSVAPFSTIVDITEFVDNGQEQIVVSGHEYLWFQWVDEKDPDNDAKLVRKIKSAHVAKIFDSADFAALEIGTEPLD